MSLSDILPNDITTITSLGSFKATPGTRENTIYQALCNVPWLDGLGRAQIIETKMLAVDRDLLFQIMMVENISKSKVTQIDDMKTTIDPRNQRVDRLHNSNPNGPSKKYKVINEVNIEEDDGNGSTESNGVIGGEKVIYKLTLQSRSGQIFYAINLKPISWPLAVLGSKIVIKKGTKFSRGMFLLAEDNAIFVGGMVKKWNEDKDLKILEYLETKANKENERLQALKDSRKRKR